MLTELTIAVVYTKKCKRTINKIPCQDALFNNDNSFLNMNTS